MREYGIDLRWVFATGRSNGAFMVNRLAYDLSEKIAAVAPVAGTLGTDVECSPALPVAVMVVHGTDDPLVPFEGGRMAGRGGTGTILSVSRIVELWRGINGCPPDATQRTLPDKGEDMTVTVASCTGCDRATAVVLYTVIGGGHPGPAAPGTCPSGSSAEPPSSPMPVPRAGTSSAPTRVPAVDPLPDTLALTPHATGDRIGRTDPGEDATARWWSENWGQRVTPPRTTG